MSDEKQQLMIDVKDRLDELAVHIMKDTRIRFNVVYSINQLKNSVLAISHTFLSELRVWNIITLFHKQNPGTDLFCDTYPQPGYWIGGGVIGFANIDFDMVYKYTEREIEIPKKRIWKPRIKELGKIGSASNTSPHTALEGMFPYK